MNACVAVSQEKPDPSFKIYMELNRTVFQSGDEAIIQIKATKDCHLTLLSLAANDSVYILFPNAIQKETLIIGNVQYEIPDEASRQAGFHIRVAPLPGYKKNTEIVKAIATKQNIPLPREIDIGRGFGLIGTPKVAVMKLAAWLSQIPFSERTEANIMYSVSSK
ncbi:DUF4384 domain-containing protein [bacterium]|nr:DUF4384 domain-containing protein [bacterium]